MSTSIKPPYIFLLKVALLALIPLLPAILFHLIFDPYKVLRSHEDYFGDGLGVNKGVVTLDAFRRNNAATDYDSFILGSSISCYYPVEEWLKYLPEGSRGMHFDSSGQSIHTTRLFLEYLDRECDSLNNVLIVMSPYIFGIKDSPESLPLLVPPAIYGNDFCRSLRFHYKFFRELSTYGYCASLIPWLISGEKEDKLDRHIFEQQPIVYSRTINEESIPEWDAEIAADPAKFYATHTVEVPDRNEPYREMETPLTEEQRNDFRKIREILNRREVDFRLILSPTLSLEVLSDSDDAFLKSLFGDGYINITRDFRDELADRTNFYDGVHYRPVLAEKYMRMAYESR